MESLGSRILRANHLIPEGLLLFLFLWYTSKGGNLCEEGEYVISPLIFSSYVNFHGCWGAGGGGSSWEGHKTAILLTRNRPHSCSPLLPQGISFSVRCPVSTHGPAAGDTCWAPSCLSKVMTNDQEVSNWAVLQLCVNFSLTPAPSVP